MRNKVSAQFAVFLLMFSAILYVYEVHAQDWSQWRGLYFNGSTDATGLPEVWSESKNMRWAVDMPGEGGSTPIIQRNRVFITSTDRENKALYALCLNRQTGKVLWQRTASTQCRNVPYNKDASPSPVADGDRAYFLYGTGEFIAMDYEGKEVWRRNLESDFGPLTQHFLYAASPLLYRKRLYVSVLRDNSTANSKIHKRTDEFLDSFLLCVDTETGEDIWKQDRPSDADGVENRDSYATPIHFESNDGAEIIIIGANYVTAHDWKSGRENWRMRYNIEEEKYRQRVVPTPLIVDGLIICIKPRYGPVFAMRPACQGNISYDSVVWEYKDRTADATSGLYYKGRLYLLHDSKKLITCLDPKTGQKIWEGKIGGKGIYHASPTAADGKIYCMSLEGEVVVLQAGDEFNILSRIEMGGQPSMSTIAIAYNNLFIRTEEKLYCVGTKKKQNMDK